MATENKGLYFECSTISDNSVEELFTKAIEEYFLRYP